MSASRRLRRAACLAALFALAAGSAAAYTLLSPRRVWPFKPSYTVDNRGIGSINDGDGGVSRTVSAITSASAWNGAGAGPGAIVAASSGSVAGWSLGDNNPMLNFQDPPSACTGSCLAATFTGYYTGTGRITDADIVTNSSGFSWTSQGEDPGGAGCSSEYYIEGIQVHEIGHGLGLNHSGTSGATMFATVSSCNNNPATIEADDTNGIRDLYPPGCSFYGTLCDPLYVSGVTCCGTLSCYKPYPGVPKYCL